MKLAEALILRADQQKRTEQLRHRLLQSAKVQEGDEPPEDPARLLEELERVAAELTRIIQRINRTNSRTPLGNYPSLTDALAVRDVLGTRQAVYRDLAEAAVVTQDRYSRSEVRFRATVDISAIQKRADELARERRELDAKIQEANWGTDLDE